MKDVTANKLDVIRERHLYIPLSDYEMSLIGRVKKETGKAKHFFVREAIVEKLEREGRL